MDGRSEPRDEVYDVVVIGSGIGGLTAGPMLARAGMKVLVAEAHDAPGGYAHAFKRGPYILDPAIHLILDERLFDDLLRYLGVRDRCTFLAFDYFYKLFLPEVGLTASFGLETFIDAHVERFPEHAQQIREFFRVSHQVFRQAHQLPPQVSLRNLDEMVGRFPVIFTYLKATLGEVLDEYFTDPKVKATCGASSIYLGLPPSKLSFVTFSQMLFGHIAEGGFYCRGGVQELVDALVTALEEHGSELALRTTVDKIMIQDGRATGVVLEGGRQIRASTVVSNADAMRTYQHLVGFEHLPERFVRDLLRLKVAVSAFIVFTATTMDMQQMDAAGALTFAYTTWDLEQAYWDTLEAKRGEIVVGVPTLADPSLAPAGEHLVMTVAWAPFDLDWDQERERYLDIALGELEALFPGFGDHLIFVQDATPKSLERFTRNYGGSIYAWENTPQQPASKRPAQRTPIEGLYLASAWVQGGNGFVRSTVKGIHLAQMLLAQSPLKDTAPPFEHEGLPPY